MRSFEVALVTLCSLGCLAWAQDAARSAQDARSGNTAAQQAWQVESKGDAAGARALLHREAQSGNASVASLKANAEFLDRHHDPGTREAYERLLSAATGPDKQAAARRLVLLDIFAEDRAAAEKHLGAYREAGGQDLTLPAPTVKDSSAKTQSVLIPGPLRSFARMAALSPE